MLSIIIPTLNEQNYIGNLLDSLKRQSYKDFEIIVIDAGSRDRTAEVVSKTDIDVPLKFINLDVKNVSMQRNKGASMANGDLLMFIDADIKFSSETDLDKIVNVFNNEKIIAATTKVKINPLERKFIDSFIMFFVNLNVNILNKIGIGNSKGACQVVRKKYFDEIKYNTKAHVAEDVQLFMKLAKKGKTVYLGNVVLYESARRYRKDGYLKTILLWTLNGLWVFFKGESYSKEWREVR